MFGLGRKKSGKGAGESGRDAAAAAGGGGAGSSGSAAPSGPAWAKSGIDYIGFEFDSPEAAAAAAASAASRKAASREGGRKGKGEGAVRVRDRAYGISSADRMHMAIFGLPGSGKSSILKLLIYQNIMRGEGFMVVDPHGELARDVLSMVPPSRYEETIYVNPATLYRFGRTVQINPLQFRNPNEKYVVVMSFVGTLFNLYKDSWGPRLETVLRNAANALIDSTEYNTLGHISEMITDETAREDILKDVTSKNVRHFWTEIFAKQYSKDAGSSAYNKIDKILSTPTVAAMFDAQKSSIDMRDIIEDGMMLVIDLSTGASDDIAQFLGSIFLNTLYVEAKNRIDVHAEDMEKARRKPFFVYVDEAHMFSNATMSEMLRALRKFGVKVTLATHTANAYEKDFANEITGLCKTLVTGRCDAATAQMLRAVMPAQVEEMQRLPNHTFALTTDEHGVSASGILRARPVPFDGRKEGEWMEAARVSVEKWGRKLSVEKYMGGGKDDRLPFSPVECLVLHLLHFDPRDWYREELLVRAKAVFPGIMENVVSGAIQRLTRERYARTVKPVPDDGDEREGQMRYVLGDKAHNGYFSEAFGGRRAGGDVHMGVIFAAARMFRRHHCYAMPDLGGAARKAAEGGEPDLYVVEPDVLTDRHGQKTYDPLNWSRRSRLAVEVETDARKHMAHTVVNYEKTAGMGKGKGRDETGKEEGGAGGTAGDGGGEGEGKAGTDGMVETYEAEGKEEGHKVWFLCFDQDSHDKLLAAIQEKTGQENPPRLEMDVVDGPKVADGRHRLPREPPELLLSGVRIRTIDQLLARDAAEAEQSEQASEHYNRADRVAAMNAARAAAKAAKRPAGKAKGGGKGGKGGSAAFTDDDYYDDAGDAGVGKGAGAGTKGGRDGGGGGRAAAAAAATTAASQPEAAPKGPYNAATAYPDKEAPANIQRRRIPKAGTLNLTALESDVYDAIAGSYGIRANAIAYVRKAVGEAAHNVSDRELQGALRELVKKRAIAVQYQTDTARVGSVDGTGERKVNKRVRVYVPVSYADDDAPGGGGGSGGGGGGEAQASADRAGEERDGAAVLAEAEAAAAASRGDETEAALQGRMDEIMEAAAPPRDKTPMGPVLRDDAEGAGDDDGASADAGDVDDSEHGDAPIDGGVDKDKDEDEDEDDISAVERERVDHGMDLAALADPTLITMLNDAGSADMHEAIRAELDRRKGQA